MTTSAAGGASRIATATPALDGSIIWVSLRIVLWLIVSLAGIARSLIPRVRLARIVTAVGVGHERREAGAVRFGPVFAGQAGRHGQGGDQRRHTSSVGVAILWKFIFYFILVLSLRSS